VLNELEQNVLATTEKISQQQANTSLDAAERNVRHLNDLLCQMSTELWKLQYDARSAAIALDPVNVLLGRSGGSFIGTRDNPLIVGDVDRIGRQLASDLRYYRSTERSGETAINSLQTLVEIENARGQDRLAMVGIILASTIALGHVLDSIHSPVLWRIPFFHFGDIDLTLGLIATTSSVTIGCLLAILAWCLYRPSND
jgi:hypothetical protein